MTPKVKMPAELRTRKTATPRFGGLDGLRALAVALVLVYHLFPAALPGGFLGVDVFFVISGFLITSLLLREIDGSGRIGLLDFWRRRARRLLPALAVVLLVSTSLALAVGDRDLLVGIGRQVTGAALFVSNWVYIAIGADYFTRDNPELFRNTWSLSIEEQFYIVLPLLLLLLLRLRGQATRAIILIVLGLASAWWMAELSVRGVEATRIYFGSDTHTFGLLLGAAAGTLLYRSGRHGRAPSAPTLAYQALWLIATVAGLGVLGWLAATLPEASPASFQGGFQLATIATIVVVASVTRHGAWIGRALDNPPMRWIGERSYGIYLWHWPLLIIVTAASSGAGEPWLIGVSTLVATLACSALSYRYLEQPVRRRGIRASLRGAFVLRGQTARHRLVAAGLGVLLAVTVPATAYAVANAPSQSTAAEAIARGQEVAETQAALVESQPTPAESSDDATSGASTRGADPSDADTSDAATSDAEASAGETAEVPPPVFPEGQDITAVGDSVMLASLPELTTAFPGIAIDAAVSRGFGAGVGIYEDAAAQGILRRVLVAGLGTNGPVEVDDLERLRLLAGDRPLVLVNASGERDWIPGVNQLLADFAASYHGVVVADWQGMVAGVPDALAGDGIHPNPSGGDIYAASVQQALSALQTPQEAVGYQVPRR